MAESQEQASGEVTTTGGQVPWDVPRIDIEWDEPGAGGIVVNGDRLVDFSIGTDWSESWNPQVNAKALAFIDALPRIVTEVQFAYDCAKRYEADLRNHLAEAAAASDGAS